MAKLILIGGYPGSGKTTKAKDFYGDCLHYETDYLFQDVGGRYRFNYDLWNMSRDFVFRMADHALARGENVVVCDLFTRKNQVFRYEQLAKYHNAELQKIWCDKQGKSVHGLAMTRVDQIMVETDGYFMKGGCEHAHV